MLKTPIGNYIRLVTQPNHAVAAGYMASHWGNEEFSKIGYYDKCQEPEKLAIETIFGIAEHDNGWWEWESNPTKSDSDNLPLGLGEVLSDPIQATQRWEIGIRRFEDSNPFASLLINYHAYRLYNVANENESSIHPLFGDSRSFSSEKTPEAISLIKTLENQQEKIKEQLDKLGGWHKDAINHENLLPNARMMQILDALSLYLCSDFIPPVSGKALGLGQDEVEIKNVPRKSWEDRVNLHITPQENGILVCDPYPFDIDNLVVPIVVTEIKNDNQNEISRMRLYKTPRKIVNFTFQKSN